jgi:FtsH-binding integral membrane protein
VKTTRPLKDGIWLGGYLLAFCWATDILVYVLIRKTLPTVHEYFLGKNQPEIGIAWVVAFFAAVLAGWLEARRRDASTGDIKALATAGIVGLILASIALTVIGIGLFDIRP